MRPHLTMLLAGLTGGLLMLRSGLFTTDAPTAALGFLLLLLCTGPVLAWVWNGMRHLPIFEVYALMHLIYYWQPAGKGGGAVLGLEPEQRVVFLGAVSLFLAAGWVVYFLMLRTLRPETRTCRFWNNEIRAMKGGRLPWAMLMLWIGFLVSIHYGVIWEVIPNILIQPVRSFCWTCGMLAIFILGHEAGQGRLSTGRITLFVASVTAGTLVHFAGGFLASGTFFASNALFAYTVGSRRLPLVSLTAFVLLVSFLNYGKGEMRARYWLMGESTDDLVELYAHWFKSSWEQFNLPEDRRQGAISGFERANLTDVCARVIIQSPAPVPFLDGKSYLDSLKLFVPRLLWPERPSIHDVMNELGLRYSIHVDIESTQSTMISLGQIAEAWANGGWLAVGLAGAFFGLIFSLGTRVAYQRGFATVGFLYGMTFVTLASNLEHLAGTLLMTFYQTAVVTLVLLYWFSRRSGTPAEPRPQFYAPAAAIEPVRPLESNHASE